MKLLYSIFKEVWRDVPGYWGQYQVSNRGRVKILQRIRQHKFPTVMPERVMIYSRTSYPQYALAKFVNGQYIPDRQSAHVLVGKTFLGGIPKGMVINHKNGIKTEVYAENLEVCTISHNVQHAYKTGLAKGKRGAEGSSAVMVLNTQNGIFYGCIKDAAESMNINHCYLAAQINPKDRHHNHTNFIRI